MDLIAETDLKDQNNSLSWYSSKMCFVFTFNLPPNKGYAWFPLDHGRVVRSRDSSGFWLAV